jgi:hypothetical protein
MFGRSGKKRLDVWLSEDHPVFKVNAGERTRMIENIGNLEIAMALIAEMRKEMLDSLSQINQAVSRVEAKIIPGSQIASRETAPAAEQAGEDDINSIYRDFGGLATAQNTEKDKKKRR